MSPRHANLCNPEPALRHITETTHRLCTSSLPVLIQGGDRRSRRSLARAIHDRSLRGNEPFVTLDCTATADQVLANLLGCERSVGFEQAGVFEIARGGTVVLDEVDRMPKGAQAALSLAINQRLLNRLGSSESTPLSARIIACAGRDLESLASQGAFHQGLQLRVSPLALQAAKRHDGGALLDSVCRFLQRHTFALQRQVRRLEATAT